MLELRQFLFSIWHCEIHILSMLLSMPVREDISLAVMEALPLGMAWKTPASSRVRSDATLTIYGMLTHGHSKLV